MKVLIVQRLLMPYRLKFFNTLDLSLGGNLSIIYGQRHSLEKNNIKDIHIRHENYYKIKNFYLGGLNNYILYQLGVLKIFCKLKPEVIILEYNPRIASNILWILLAILFRKKLILWGLGILANQEKSSIKKFIYKIYSFRADAILCYSSFGKHSLLNVGIEEKKIKVVYNSTVNPNPATPNRITSKLKDNSFTFDNPLKLIFIGRLIKSKDIDLLTHFIESSPLPVQLDVYGDGPMLSELKKQNNSKTFFHGNVSQDELSEPLFNAHFCLLPGRGGLAIQHAMAHGCPVICGIADGTQDDFIKNEINGYVASDDYFYVLENILQKSINNPEHIYKLSYAAYEQILQSNVDTMTEKFRNAIDANL